MIEKELSSQLTHEVIPVFGSPVFDTGLEADMSHLNGKLGDVRDLNYENPDFFWIHFEDDTIEPTFIKRRTSVVSLSYLTKSSLHNQLGMSPFVAVVAI